MGLGFVSTALAADQPHWGYSGEHGPGRWAAEFPGCAGFNQSPVDIASPVEATLPALAMDYQPSTLNAVNNGHTVQYNYDGGSTLTVNGKPYDLLQFHFHSPSENHVSGRSFPVESHLVHKSEDGALAVVGLMFEEGEANALLDTLWRSMPMAAEETTSDEATRYNVSDLLPADTDYYRFAGSLTTPPCTEGVTWLVMKSPVIIGGEQVAKFREAMGGHDTNRPVQPLNARVVMQ
jgi:carbonic anhydrase